METRAPGSSSPAAQAATAEGESLLASGGATGFLLRGAWSALACVMIAIPLWLAGGARFADTLLGTVCVGLLCWVFIDGGRMALARTLARLQPGNVAACLGWPGWGPMTAVIVVGAGAAYILGKRLADTLAGYGPSLSAGPSWRGFAPLFLMTLLVSLVVTGFFYARGRLASARAEAESARRLALETQLRLIESQLEPHMLFNTLANLRVLIGADPSRALAMLDHLVAFLRATLAASRSRTHSLAAEFERVADYLALMQMRMGPRLVVTLELPDDLRELRVPPLLLQPLVENCIKHGLEPDVTGGRIDVRARCDAGVLRLTVRDTGAGLAPASPASGTGFGTTQVRERLAALYGERASLTLGAATDHLGGGTLALVEMPLVRP